jgi:GntR family transcriptional regulator/MocR family aminotransferase
MADYITSGDYARRLRQLRHDRKARRDSLIQALMRHFGAVTLRGLSGGMHVVWHLPPRLPPAQALEAGAAERGVRVYSPQSAGADMTGCARLNTRLLVFGYASLTPEEIESGIATLAACARAAAE